MMLVLSLLMLLCPPDGSASADKSFNLTPFSPPQLDAHFLSVADGSVNVGADTNRLTTVAIEGTPFLKKYLKLNQKQIKDAKQEAIAYWKNEFGLDGNYLNVLDGSVSITQFNPAFDERIYLITTPCQLPLEGFRVLNGGFQLVITNPNGVTVTNPNTGQPKTYPQFTSMYFCYFAIITTPEGVTQCKVDTCGNRYKSGLEIPPAVIIVPWKSRNADFVESLSDQLIHVWADQGNYFGCGICSGLTTLSDNGTSITSRLVDYCTFPKGFACKGTRNAIWEPSKAPYVGLRY